MIPPLPGGTPGQDGAELEALQADVMRFVAIIGLCLAAIFSLLQEVAPEPAQSPFSAADGSEVVEVPPAPPAGIPATEPVSKHEPVLPPGRHPVQAPSPQTAPREKLPAPPVAEPAPPAPDSPADRARAAAPDSDGFTLSFSSPEALYALLENGAMQLFASDGSAHWQYMAREGVFRQAPAPAEYFLMDALTVPAVLRDRAVALGIDIGRWGVVLPAATRRQLGQILRDRRGGDLRIDARGQVHLEAGHGDPPGR